MGSKSISSSEMTIMRAIKVKRTSYELREARKEAGLTVANVSSLARISPKTWQKWEAPPGSAMASRTPEYAFQFLRCYSILKKHNLLEELLKPEDE